MGIGVQTKGPDSKVVAAVPEGLAARLARTRARSEALAASLTDAEATLQSMPDASPAKWHLAHTTWFFETFVLRDHAPGYTLFDARWPFLFNSYYEAEGPRHARPQRGMLARPTLDEILAWRAHVNDALSRVETTASVTALLELGIAHEEQHQELLLTDIKHAFAQNPLGPALVDPMPPRPAAADPSPLLWREHPGGEVMIGHAGPGFAFDNEGPAHRVLLEPFALADRLVTNAEWDAFIADGGYRTPSLWLSDGWDRVRAEGWDAPLYWRDGEQFSHAGWIARRPSDPVTHISCYEADAFATWAGARLPTECEWESAAGGEDPANGDELDTSAPVLPKTSPSLFGSCWQWTRSAYLPYPRFRPAAGAVGEYNGKFMSGQMVLRGSSCATPRGHARASYRNFFPPATRWQFSGLRLARDC